MKKLLVAGSLAVAMLLGSGVGHAATNSCSNTSHNCSASDGHSTTIEPILTRSEVAKVDSSNSPAPNKIGNVNIQSYSFTASSGHISIVIHLRTPFIHTPTAAADPNTGMSPYSGQHILTLFQTNQLQNDGEVVGKSATGTDVHWNQHVYNADGFRWLILFGWTLSEYDATGALPYDGATCNAGYYDPTGALVSNVPLFLGQTFFSVGQKATKYTGPNPQGPGNVNTNCSLSADGKTLTISQPYVYTYSDSSGLLPRHKTIVSAGDTISNVSAFSWLDHEIGGPQPVGLVLGWTWYTDNLPENSYRYGTVAGDPNPNKFQGPKCLQAFVDSNNGGSSPLDGVLGPLGPCTIANPVGAGFVDTHNNVTAG